LFDLRAALCSADMTLEWPRTEKDGRRFQVDGGNIPHVCASEVSLVVLTCASCCL